MSDCSSDCTGEHPSCVANVRGVAVIAEPVQERYHRITLTLGEPQITMEDTQASVSFTQNYHADDYHDYGMKLLNLTKEEGMWKIVAEQWEPLEQPVVKE